MVQIRRALVVGGGIAGLSAALCLRRLGTTVDLLELDPQWGVHGAGLTLTGASLRALETLGLLDEIRREGFIGPGTQFHGADGSLFAELNDNDNTGALALSGGILRTALHRVMVNALAKANVEVRLGIALQRLENVGRQVRVTCSDMEPELYDLVIGADGIYSQVRALMFPEVAPPKRTGQGCWRVLARRPAGVDKPVIVLGGRYPLGFTLLSPDRMYMFLLEPVVEGSRTAAHDNATKLTGLMQGYGGLVERVRSEISNASEINFRPLEAILVPAPWFRGRVLLMGDAAHATTPHLATGAGLAIEDALVFTEELAKAASVEAALAAHMERRFARCAMVVENSVKIGECQLQGNAVETMLGLMQGTSQRLLEMY